MRCPVAGYALVAARQALPEVQDLNPPKVEGRIGWYAWKAASQRADAERRARERLSGKHGSKASEEPPHYVSKTGAE